MIFGSSRAAAGKSHSWVTAITSDPTPSANNVSVADGTRLTMRIANVFSSGRRRAIDFPRAAGVNKLITIRQDLSHVPSRVYQAGGCCCYRSPVAA